MTEITDEEIGNRKRELGEERERKYNSEKAIARKEILNGLAVGRSDGVLELSERYDIEIPSGILRKIADEYSKSNSSDVLYRAYRAYKKLGDNEKLNLLEEKIREVRDGEIAGEIVEAMTR